MKTLNLIQGTQEWLEARAEYFSASDANAMLGYSKFKSRDQLLREKKLWKMSPADYWAEQRFRKGHELEEKARPIAEKISEMELYPVTGVSEEHPMLLASFDGLDLLEDECWEHKGWNKTLAENVRNKMLEDHYWPQLEQQLLVSGASLCLFMTSDGTEENCEYFYYESIPERRQQIIEGWKQFEKDLAEYELAQIVEVIKPDTSEYPAISYEVKGVDVVSNIAILHDAVKAEVARRSQLGTVADQDVRQHEESAKNDKKMRAKLKEIVAEVRAQYQSFDQFNSTASEIDSMLQKMQSSSEKVAKEFKTAKKRQIVDSAIESVNTELSSIRLTQAAHGGSSIECEKYNPFSLEVLLAEAMKGKKTLSSCQQAADECVARLKAEISTLTDTVLNNVAYLEQLPEGDKASASQILLSTPPDDYQALVAGAIALSNQKSIELDAPDSVEESEPQPIQAEVVTTDSDLLDEARKQIQSVINALPDQLQTEAGQAARDHASELLQDAVEVLSIYTIDTDINPERLESAA